MCWRQKVFQIQKQTFPFRKRGIISRNKKTNMMAIVNKCENTVRKYSLEVYKNG